METQDREQRVVEKEGWDDDTGFCIERSTNPTDKVRYPRPAQKIMETRDREHGSWNWKGRFTETTLQASAQKEGHRNVN